MRIAVVIPAYRASSTICGVIAGVGPQVSRIYVVDDGCPDGTGDRAAASGDPRVVVLRNAANLGVGGATVRGYREALAEGLEIVVKMDADGQMDPAMLPRLLAPILARQADYTKGNRFAARYQTWRRARQKMPPARLIGNSILSFLHKAVSGYWNILDPTNGYTAVHRCALESVSLEDLSEGYFFENDMLFQLNLAGAVVQDVPMPAVYAGEKSYLRVGDAVLKFPGLLLQRFVTRVFFRYFISDFNIASLELITGMPLLLGGVVFGGYRWLAGISGPPNTPGTVMLCALPIIVGFQLLLSAITFDILSVPKVPLCRLAAASPPDAPDSWRGRG